MKRSVILRRKALPNDRELRLIATRNGFPLPFYVVVANLKVSRTMRYNAGRGQYFRSFEAADKFFEDALNLA